MRRAAGDNRLAGRLWPVSALVDGTVDAIYVKGASALAKTMGSPAPPKTILNAPTKLMKSEGYGADYEYDHDSPDAFSGQNYWPDAIGRRVLYEPVERGFERELRKRLDYWARLRRERGRG